MRAQIHIIAVLTSLLLWVTSLHAAQMVYREAHQAGVIPNLHLKHHIRDALRELA